MKENLFIIVLHFGDIRVTRECLGSIVLSKIKYKEVVLVDNSSNFTRPKNLKIRLIKPRKNLGYAAGMNTGIKYALSKDAQYFLLLNNDTIVEKEFASELISFFKKYKKAGIVGPAIKFSKQGKMIYDLGGRVNFLFGRTSHYEVERVTLKRPTRVDYISGCCMFIKREVLEKIGLLDERFFLYYEDVDFCLRAKKAGFKTFVLPKVHIYHKLSSSVGKNSAKAIYHQTKSGLLFGEKVLGAKRFFNYMYLLLQSLYIFLKNPLRGRYAFLAFMKRN